MARDIAGRGNACDGEIGGWGAARNEREFRRSRQTTSASASSPSEGSNRTGRRRRQQGVRKVSAKICIIQKSSSFLCLVYCCLTLRVCLTMTRGRYQTLPVGLLGDHPNAAVLNSVGTWSRGLNN